MAAGDAFLAAWAGQALEQARAALGGTLPKGAEERVLELGRSRARDFPAEVHNNRYNKRKTTTGLIMADYFLSGKPVIAGSGMMYKQHAESTNLPAKLLEHLGAERKRVKKEMFEHVNDVDKTAYNALDTKQRVIKVLSNSWFGVMGQPTFVFHNKYNGPAITYSGYAMITHAVLALEEFLANNVRFRNMGQVLRFFASCMRRSPRTPVHLLMSREEVQQITAAEVAKYLTELCDFGPTEEEQGIMTQMAGSYLREDLWKVMFRRNLYRFLSVPSVFELLGECLDDSFLDPGSPPEAIKANIDRLCELLDDWVAHDELHEDRFERAHSMTRKAVLLCDTDSSFLNLAPFYDFIAARYDLGDPQDRVSYIPVCNVITHVLSRFIHGTLHRFARHMNVSEGKLPLIAMKSEYLFSRIVLTDNKKQYASSIVLNEGRMLATPKIEIRGLSIKKTGVNKITRDYFGNVLKDLILEVPVVSVPAVLRAYRTYEERIREGLVRDLNAAYSTPAKFSSWDSYKNPLQMPVVRGVMLWNLLNPERPIGSHEKVNLLKTKGSTREEVASALSNYPAERDLILAELDKRASPNDMLAQALQKYGVSVLAVPKDDARLPAWCSGLVDAATMVSDIMSNTIVLVESLGATLIEVRDRRYHTNMVRM